ncbi:MAG TPA: hypothetical protein VFZ64_01630 [Nocardioidaceae bacterium]
MIRVLYVCTANIARSAYAEVITANAGFDELEVGSAGTHGWVDHPMYEHMAAELERRGVDPSGFRSRRLTPAIIDEADLVLTMTAAHRGFVLQERPGAVTKTFTVGQLARALDEVPREVSGLEAVAAGRRLRATADAEDDVADPYGRGPEAAALAADRLDTLLDRILLRL